ncbi:MAG TPA: polymer-forming cytoskeletal protein, partial [Polyangiaceae bacterium]|nr:polymer-forming cytoskeletal protein [Polyangiaceae bacterium]
MASTVIGAGITIEGEITTDEDVVVAGTLKGKLSAKEGVTVEHGATVEADVVGGSLVVAGSLTGNV